MTKRLDTESNNPSGGTPGRHRVLAIATVPGDEVFGCGGTLARHVTDGDTVNVVVVSNGCRDVGDGATRTGGASDHGTECRAAARVLGCSEPLLWSEPLSGISYGERLIQRITAMITETDATLVYAPSPQDPDPNRSAMGLNVREAIRRATADPVLACYELSHPLQIDESLDISNFLPRKRAAMECFSARSDDTTESLNRLRAGALEQPSQAAEGFAIVGGSALTRPVPGSASRPDRMPGGDMTSEPLVSVMVRSQNRPELTDALDSIALQTYRHIEVVLIDVSGTGSFETGEWCGPFPLRIASTGHHLNRGAAANVGLDHALGRYLLFLDDDDWLLPNHVALLVAALRGSDDHAVAYSGIECRRMTEQSAWEVVRVFNDPFDRRRVLTENFIPIHAVLFDHSLIDDQARFDESLDVYEDWDFWVQLSDKSDFLHVDAVTAIYRISRDSGFAVRADPRTGEGLQAFFEKWLRRWSPQDLIDVVAYHQEKSALERADAQRQIDELRESLSERDRRLAEIPAEATQLSDVWATAFASCDSRIAEIQERAAQQLEALAEKLAERDSRIAEIQERAAQQLEALAANLAERDSRVAAMHAQAAQRSEAWAATMAERDSSIAELSARLDEAASEIEHLTRALTDSKTSIDRLTDEQARKSARTQALEDALTKEQASTAALKAELASQNEGWKATLAVREARIGELDAELTEAIAEVERLRLAERASLDAVEQLTRQEISARTDAQTLENALEKEKARIAELLADQEQRANALQTQERLIAGLRGQLHAMGDQRQRIISKLTNLYVSAAWSISARICATERRFPQTTRAVLRTTKAMFWALTFNLPSALRRRAQARRIVESGLFDQHWYTQTYPDVLMNGYRPVIHWMLHGWREGLDPSPLFDTNWYLDDKNTAVLDKENVDPITHYLDEGWTSGRSPHPLFDSKWYLRTYPDVKAAGVDPFRHFIRVGVLEGRNPNPYFDTDWYREQNPDSLQTNPLHHYVTVGAPQGRNPSPRFDTQLYWSRHPESHHHNPLAHYLNNGAIQNQSTGGEPPPEPIGSGDSSCAAIADWHGDWSTLFPATRETPRRILVIDWKPPTPDRDSGSYRMRMILDLLLSAGHQVDFVGDQAAEDPIYAQSLRDLGIEVIIGPKDTLAHLQVNGGEYRAIWISRPELVERYLTMARAFAVRARVLYDTVDLHWVRFQRGIEFADDPEAMRELAERYQRLEISNARATDLTIAITAEEQQALLAQDPDLSVAIIPNVHQVSEEVKPPSGRTDLFFIGGFNHAPNVDAVTWCAREIIALVQARLPGIRLHIVGSDMPDRVYALASAAIHPIGYVEDVKPWFERSRVFIAPLRHGAGMKGKVGQSLSHGLPVVTTPIGAEGIGLTNEANALIANDPEEFVEAIVRLCNDDELWSRISNNGLELMKQRYSTEAVASHLLPLLA